MKIGAIIQARMSSARLPGKVLKPLAGKPLLQYLLESLARVPALAGVVVATSEDSSDDAVAQFCAQRDAACYRGSLDDVVLRLLGAAAEQGFDAFVRVCADSPLLDYRLVAEGVVLFCESDVDLVTNVWPRSFPKGQSVEVIDTAALMRAHGAMDREDREHVTRYLYAHPDQARILNFGSGQSRRSAGDDWGSLNMCIDTAEDFGRIEQLLAGLPRPHWQYSVVDLVTLFAESRVAVV